MLISDIFFYRRFLVYSASMLLIKAVTTQNPTGKRILFCETISNLVYLVWSSV